VFTVTEDHTLLAACYLHNQYADRYDPMFFVMDILMQNGANPNNLSDGKFFFCYTSYDITRDFVSLLVRNNFDFFAPDSTGFSYVNTLKLGKMERVISMLCDHDVNLGHDLYKVQPTSSIVNYILRNKIDVNWSYRDGSNLLERSISRVNYREMINLIDAGAFFGEQFLISNSRRWTKSNIKSYIAVVHRVRPGCVPFEIENVLIYYLGKHPEMLAVLPITIELSELFKSVSFADSLAMLVELLRSSRTNIFIDQLSIEEFVRGIYEICKHSDRDEKSNALIIDSIIPLISIMGGIRLDDRNRNEVLPFVPLSYIDEFLTKRKKEETHILQRVNICLQCRLFNVFFFANKKLSLNNRRNLGTSVYSSASLVSPMRELSRMLDGFDINSISNFLQCGYLQRANDHHCSLNVRDFLFDENVYSSMKDNIFHSGDMDDFRTTISIIVINLPEVIEHITPPPLTYNLYYLLDANRHYTLFLLGCIRKYTSNSFSLIPNEILMEIFSYF
jgi:hypothetical protein